MITLGIIGVVAALTMPSLIEKHQKKQTVVQLKKAYSVMANAFRNAENEYGPISTWDDVWNWEYYDENNNPKFVDKYLLQSLKNYDFKLRPQSIYPIKGMAPTQTGYMDSNTQKWFYLNNGTCFRFDQLGNASRIIYDINGDAKPNIVGKDIFWFTINGHHGYKFKMFIGTWGDFSGPMTKAQRDSLLTNTPNGYAYSCNKMVTNTYANSSCGAMIEYDGWQISNDYPW